MDFSTSADVRPGGGDTLVVTDVLLLVPKQGRKSKVLSPPLMALNRNLDTSIPLGGIHAEIALLPGGQGAN